MSSPGSGSRPIKRKRRRKRAISALRGAQHLAHRADIVLPLGDFLTQLAAPARRQAIELGAAVVLREPPLRFDPAPPLEPVQGGIERPFFNQKGGVGALPDPGCNVVAMGRPPGEGLEDQEIEGALQETQILKALSWGPT